MIHSYDKQTIWSKAIAEDGKDPNIWRKDIAGAWIRYDQFGKHTPYGWVIDHVRPLLKGGDDSLENLQPLHWRNNKFKGDNYPKCQTCIGSEGKVNKEIVRLWKIE